MWSLGCEQKGKRTASIGPVSASRQWTAGLRTRAISTPTGFYNKAWGRRDNGAPQENTHKTPMNPNGVPHRKCEFFVRASQVVEPRLGFGEISIFLPGVRRKAATPGFVVEPVPG